MIFVTGDTHMPVDIGKLGSKYFLVQKKLTKNDYVIICGDFGGVWNNSKEDKYWLDWLEERNFTTLFVDGNHENFDLLKAYEIKEWNGGRVQFIRDSIIHLMRGQVYEIDGLKFFTMGGGSSRDKRDRVLHKSWWLEEMPSDGEYNEAFDNLEKHNREVDYIITHAAPESIMSRVRTDYMDERPLNRFLEYVRSTVSYKQWFMGHLHQDKRWDEKHRLLYYDIVQI